MAVNFEFCQVCFKRNISKSSISYCFECDQSLCSDCESCHSSIQATSEHVAMSMSDYLSLGESFKSIRNHCSNHNEKYQMYCQSHEIPLCLSCLEEHSACKDVITLTKFLQNVKLSQFVKDIEDSLKDLEKNVSIIKTHLQKNRENFNTDKTAVLSEISKTRKQINDHLDKLEQSLRDEVIQQEKKVTQQFDSVLTSVDNKTSKVLSQKNLVSILKNQGTNIHTFLALKQVSLHLNLSEKEIKTMIKNGSLDRLSLKCNINDKLSRLFSEIQTFGGISIETTSSNIKLDDYKERQAQHVITENKSLDNVNKKLVLSYDIKSDNVLGCDITEDGKILHSDYSKNSLVCHDSNGKHLFDISIEPNCAFDVTCIDDTTVDVTSGSSNVISIVEISNQTVKKRINVGYYCYGITYRDGTLLTCAAGHGILSVRLTDEKLTTIVQCDLPSWSYITTNQDKLYYENNNTKVVTCCDMEGNTIWTFKDEAVISCPYGITTDNEGRVYVCDNGYSKVIVLSSDGKQSKQLVSKDDGLSLPWALHFDKKRNNLLIANWKDKIFLFRVTS